MDGGQDNKDDDSGSGGNKAQHKVDEECPADGDTSTDCTRMEDDGREATEQQGVNLLSLLPDEVLEFVLSLSSPYGDVRAAALTSTRLRDCATRVRARSERDFVRAAADRALRWTSQELQQHQQQQVKQGEGAKPAAAPVITKRYSHSSCYDDATLSMYVFGGCTSTSSTFNDLWRLDLTSRSWHRPVATGSYPSPKACAVMVLHEASHSLLLFGGWTHPSLYPLHQSWRLFNELHQYDIGQARWTHVSPNSSLKPPAMAGHSATVHRYGDSDLMVVFGGLHKQRNSIGQFSSSNDVWCFDLETRCWSHCDVAPGPGGPGEQRPTPRYGQSQIRLDDEHLLVLGGCGGPNNVFNDVWLLEMKDGGAAAPTAAGGAQGWPHWRWHRCEVRNAEANGAGHMWCHPAVRVDDYAVVLGKTRVVAAGAVPAGTAGSKSTAAAVERDPSGAGLSDSETARFNVIPHLRRGINRGYGAIRRQNTSERHQRQQQQQQQGAHAPQPSRRFSESDMDHDGGGGLEVEPVPDGAAAAPSSSKSYRTSVKLNVNQDDAQQQQSGPSPPLRRELSLQGLPGAGASGAQLPRAPPEMARLQAFTVGSPSTYTSSSVAAPPPPPASGGAIPKNPARQLQTRQRQLETLKRMEDRIKSMDKKDRPPPAAPSNQHPPEQHAAAAAPGGNSSCTCHRLSTYVLDISQAVSQRVVTWLDVRPAGGLSHAPEETILYTLVRGRAELVLFGGIQKDVSSMTSRQQAASSSSGAETVSNSVYYLCAPRDVV